MEPSPAKKPKFDPRQLTPEDGEAIRKLMGNLEKLLKSKNQALCEVQKELRDVKEVVKRDPSLRIFVHRICVNYPLDQIKVYLNQLNCINIIIIYVLNLGQVCSIRKNFGCRGESRI
jgi:hypothetical protein